MLRTAEHFLEQSSYEVASILLKRLHDCKDNPALRAFFIENVSSSDPWQCSRACWALWEFGGDDAINAIIKKLAETPYAPPADTALEHLKTFLSRTENYDTLSVEFKDTLINRLSNLLAMNPLVSKRYKEAIDYVKRFGC